MRTHQCYLDLSSPSKRVRPGFESCPWQHVFSGLFKLTELQHVQFLSANCFAWSGFRLIYYNLQSFYDFSNFSNMDFSFYTCLQQTVQLLHVVPISHLSATTTFNGTSACSACFSGLFWLFNISAILLQFCKVFMISASSTVFSRQFRLFCTLHIFCVIISLFGRRIDLVN